MSVTPVLPHGPAAPHEHEATQAAGGPSAPITTGGLLSGPYGTRVVAAVLLGVSGIAIWMPVLGAGVLWGTPMLIISVLMIAGVIPIRRTYLGWLWVPFAFLCSGLPLVALAPTQLGSTYHRILEAVAVGLRDPGAGSDRWMLAAWLCFSGIFWFRGAVQSRRLRPGSAAIAFVDLTVPFASAMVLRRADDAAWHGALLLVGALLWATRGHLRAALPAAFGVAVAGTVVSMLIGPTEPWKGALGTPSKPPLTQISTDQPLGPLPNDITGRRMFEMAASSPGLWRVGVLDRFDGRLWRTTEYDADAQLPQPAARPERTWVTLDGLRDERLAAPGTVTSMNTVGDLRIGPGDAAFLTPMPSAGSFYSTTDAVVTATPEQLAGVPRPQASAYPKYTALDGDPASSGIAPLIPLAQQLSAGTNSELEVVRRVKSFLDDGGRFRYTTNVPRPGGNPWVEFLLTKRIGYCQYFAGGAGLLLRLAGIPARVVSGWATGKPGPVKDGVRTYTVRDEDFHAWIEVYFPTIGWVPVDVTPSATRAAVDQNATPLGDATGGGGGGGGGPTGEAGQPSGARNASGGVPAVALILGLVAMVAGITLFVVRRRRRRLGSVLPPVALADVLVRLVPGPVEAGTTLSQLRADFVRLGPATTALVDAAEQRRFGPDPSPAETQPRRRMWSALRSDVGVPRAVWLLVAGPRSRAALNLVGVGEHADAVPRGESLGSRDRSVAPPG